MDARALLNARTNRWHLIADSVALFIGGALIVAGQPLGIPIAIVAAALLSASQLQSIQRWMIARESRGLLGQRTDVTVDGAGVRLASELGSSDVPWSILTTVRADQRTVIFVRDRILAAYIPATSFTGPEEQAALVRFGLDRITAAAAGHDADAG